jgi:LmbE family N-acetylglucosaminyl deacetylase
MSRVLVIAPHADDETLGMGGTIARYAREGHEVIVAVVTGHGDEGPHPLWPREVWDRVRAEARSACAVLDVKQLLFDEVPAAMVADQPLWKLNQVTGAIVERVQPDSLFVPFRPTATTATCSTRCRSWRPSSAVGRKIRVC